MEAKIRIAEMRTSGIQSLLQCCLEEGMLRMGQVAFTKDLRVFHVEDAGRTDLQVYEGPDAAREIARFDDTAQYRPLKTAPNLRHGWELRLSSVGELRLALDFLYPAAIGLWLALLRQELVDIPLRQTLGRQSGMYRVTARITDTQAQDLVRNFCGRGCLRKILWSLEGLAESQVESRGTEIPLLCSEACNLFVAEARRIVKATPVS